MVGKPAKKGERPGGRAKGTPNKATTDVRAAVALLAERNISKLESWLTRTARKNPAKAADLFLRALEYHIPKMREIKADVTERPAPAMMMVLTE